jgi:two-component system nitrate/nitrite response regulator NarL
MNNELRVALVEDDVIFAEVVSEHLASAIGFGPVSVFHTATSALWEIARSTFHIALIDLRLGGMSGLECIRRLREKEVTTKLLAFTSSDDPDTIVEVLRAGADGYLLKNQPMAELVPSLMKMCTGRPVVSEALWPSILKSFRGAPAPRLQKLTRSEQNVLALTAEGLDCKTIGRRLGISVNTVYVHNKRIIRKVGVGNRNAAAAVLRKQTKETEALPSQTPT